MRSDGVLESVAGATHASTTAKSMTVSNSNTSKAKDAPPTTPSIAVGRANPRRVSLSYNRTSSSFYYRLRGVRLIDAIMF
ncbi:hypothetical protein BD410DRAFT_278350 [Rickenella mellea]|uniref:Uncharacterized protein n=1 Tax=Rickenella mellea TaxID=50990 RepID=A0A4Y7Q4B8_9AGAM|nr:hypothetical protein BD410DRAFT_278350 [Rickenella mellea]